MNEIFFYFVLYNYFSVVENGIIIKKIEKRLIVYNDKTEFYRYERSKFSHSFFVVWKKKLFRNVYANIYILVYVHWYASSISEIQNLFRLFGLQVISCICDFYLCNDKDKRISTRICALDRSVVLSKVSGSAIVSESTIMSSELDIKNYFEFVKELTLKAGEVSYNKTFFF